MRIKVLRLKRFRREHYMCETVGHFIIHVYKRSKHTFHRRHCFVSMKPAQNKEIMPYIKACSALRLSIKQTVQEVKQVYADSSFKAPVSRWVNVFNKSESRAEYLCRVFRSRTWMSSKNITWGGVGVGSVAKGSWPTPYNLQTTASAGLSARECSRSSEEHSYQMYVHGEYPPSQKRTIRPVDEMLQRSFATVHKSWWKKTNELHTDEDSYVDMVFRTSKDE